MFVIIYNTSFQYMDILLCLLPSVQSSLSDTWLFHIHCSLLVDLLSRKKRNPVIFVRHTAITMANEVIFAG